MQNATQKGRKEGGGRGDYIRSQSRSLRVINGHEQSGLINWTAPKANINRSYTKRSIAIFTRDASSPRERLSSVERAVMFGGKPPAARFATSPYRRSDRRSGEPALFSFRLLTKHSDRDRDRRLSLPLFSCGSPRRES